MGVGALVPKFGGFGESAPSWIGASASPTFLRLMT